MKLRSEWFLRKKEGWFGFASWGGTVSPPAPKSSCFHKKSPRFFETASSMLKFAICNYTAVDVAKQDFGDRLKADQA
jgi:hypothetical protein